MDGLFNLVGRRTVDLTAHGKTYTLTLRTLADYAIKEAAILQTAGNPYDGITKLTDDQQRVQAIKAIAEVASRPKIATLADEQRFDNSMRGIAYNVWRCLSVAHPDEFPPTAEINAGVQLGMDFIEWYGLPNLGDIVNAIFHAQEQDILGNSDGQTTDPLPPSP